MNTTVNLNTDGPCDSQYVLEVAEAFAESVRVLNHLTRHSEALEYPAEVDSLVRYVAEGVSRLPQLLQQAGARLEAMRETGVLRVVSDDYLQTAPDTAVMRARVSLDEARAFLEGAQAAIAAAAAVTSGLAAVPAPDEEETVVAAALEPPGPGVRCHDCGVLPDEQHDEGCPERDPGPVWPGGGG